MDEIRPATYHGPETIELTSQESNSDPKLKKSSTASMFPRFIQTFDEHPQDPDENADQLFSALNQSLKGYHSQLIALASAIGTGLFIASGEGLATAGPIPLLAAFSFVGLSLCPTIFALGEMATLFPKPGGFFEHCRMYTDEAWGGAMGWNYVLQWLITLPLELVASSITLQYWGNPLKHHAAWVTMFLVLIIVINLLGVRRFADFEAALSVMKVVAILGFILFCVLRDVGLGFDGKAIGTSNWYNPGAAHNGWYGFCSVLIIAAFAYSGSEVVGLTAAEQEDPKRDMPRAIRKVFWRVGLFYITAIFLVGLLVPDNDTRLINAEQSYDSKASPFVIALLDSGVQVLPGIMNVVILITVISVGNSSVYGSSRVLGAMAKAGLAPKVFDYVDNEGRPLKCFFLSFAFGFLAFLADLRDENTVFIWLLSLCGLSSIISWTSICATHIRFRQALKLHKKPVETLPYQSPLGVVGSWIGLLCNLFIIVIQFVTAVRPVGYHEMSGHEKAIAFFQSFMAFPLTGLVYLGFKFFKGTKIHGIALSKRGLTFNNPHISWGQGTTVANLRTGVSFENSWKRGDYQRYAMLNPHKVIRVEELWWCPTPLRPLIKFFYLPWEKHQIPPYDAEMALGEKIISKETLLEAVQTDSRGVFGYIYHLRTQKEIFLRDQFAADGTIDAYIVSQEELLSVIGRAVHAEDVAAEDVADSIDSVGEVFEYIERLRAETDALRLLSHFGESEAYYLVLSDIESDNHDDSEHNSDQKSVQLPPS